MSFANTIFINLKERPDRLQHVQAQLKSLHIDHPIRLDAIKHEIGAIGCTLSHIQALKIAKSRQIPHVFICEDDITFSNPQLLAENTARFFNEMPDWDVLILGGNNLPPYEALTPHYIRISNCQTTTGYIVRQHFYDTLIANFEESVIHLMREPANQRQFALDIYWKRLQKSGRWYMIVPPTVYQYQNYSDIEKTNKDYRHLMLDLDKKWYFSQFTKK